MLPISPRELTNSIPSSSSIDPYQVLQIRRDATTAEIQNAYKRLALLHHPVRRKGQQIQLFEILAACYETLMDKEARLRCDVLLQDQETALLHRTLSWSSSMKQNNNNKKNKVVGLLLPNSAGTTEGADNHMLGFVGLNTMPSLAEMSSCGGSSMDESFLTQEDTTDWKSGCIPESHHVDGQEQVEIVYSLDSLPYWEEDPSSPPPRKHIDTECEKDRCASPVSADRSSLRPLRILHSRQSSWDDEDEDSAAPHANSTKTPLLDSEVQHSNSTDNSCPEETQADMHYSGAEIDRMFGGPLQLLFRARRWQVFKDPYQVFAEVFGGPLYGDIPHTLLSSPKKAGPSIRTAFQLPPPMEKLPSEHVSRRTTIHRTRRLALGKEIVRTAVVRIDPRTKQRFVTISVTTEDLSIPDEEDLQLNSFFRFLDSLCIGLDGSGSGTTCLCFDFSICT